ncbi:MAG: hydrogenase formation protein HypD [Candidatus Hermodarchaeia archaeon]|jgi:hydrogenase expression/formation protein HypD
MAGSFANMDPLELQKGFRDPQLAHKAAQKIKELAKNRTFKFMHLCGTHEYTITHSGLRDLLPENVELIAGPGCPVCVCPPEDVALAIAVANQPNALLTTFGDMIRVPAGDLGSLNAARSKGAKVQVVYSMMDAIIAAKENPDKEVVHFAIGFETTTPPTAAEILGDAPKNFSVLVSHRLIPPAEEFLLDQGEVGLHGFLLPGHVSVIIGVQGYEHISKQWKVPQVIAGFEPLDVLLGIVMLLQQVKDGRGEVENEYTRAVTYEGNVRAREIIEQVFVPVDSRWRGIGIIPESGLALREEYMSFDVRTRFKIELEHQKFEMPPGCKCGEVLRGIMRPEECPLFGTKCTPENPIGPCMVSTEGTCSVVYGAQMIP